MKRDIFSLTAAKYLPIIHNFVFISLQEIYAKRFKKFLKIFAKYQPFRKLMFSPLVQLSNPKVYMVFCVYKYMYSQSYCNPQMTTLLHLASMIFQTFK